MSKSRQCDICEKEIQRFDKRHKFKTIRNPMKKLDGYVTHNLDMCADCYEKLCKFVYFQNKKTETKEMIVSIYDGGYNCTVLIDEKELYGAEANKICLILDNFKSNSEVIKLMNEYNVERLVLCNSGNVRIYEGNVEIYASEEIINE